MNVEYRRDANMLSSRTTNASTPPRALGARLPTVVGKFTDVVLPVTKTLPSLPSAIAKA